MRDVIALFEWLLQEGIAVQRKKKELAQVGIREESGQMLSNQLLEF